MTDLRAIDRDSILETLRTEYEDTLSSAQRLAQGSYEPNQERLIEVFGILREASGLQRAIELIAFETKYTPDAR